MKGPEKMEFLFSKRKKYKKTKINYCFYKFKLTGLKVFIVTHYYIHFIMWLVAYCEGGNPVNRSQQYNTPLKRGQIDMWGANVQLTPHFFNKHLSSWLQSSAFVPYCTNIIDFITSQQSQSITIKLSSGNIYGLNDICLIKNPRWI